jgi:hypothetical protein
MESKPRNPLDENYTYNPQDTRGINLNQGQQHVSAARAEE